MRKPAFPDPILARFVALRMVNGRGEMECCHCGTAPASCDRLGLAWCDAPICRARRELLFFGEQHGYPALQSPDEYGYYACAAGILHWITTALLGSDAYLEALMAAIMRRIETGEDEG